jgi:hypothetical protein
MAQKSGNSVKAPVDAGGKGDAPETRTMRENLTDQHHGENTKSLQDDKKIGQHNSNGRPPLMKK